MKTDEITNKINMILKPYLGRLEYGNLRKANEWPSNSLTNLAYNIMFEIDTDSSDGMVIEVWDDRTTSINCMSHRYSLEGGLKRYERLIKAIPNYRVKRTIKRVEYEIKNKFISSFEEFLEKKRKELNKMEGDFYTQRQLIMLRRHFSDTQK